GHVPQGPPKPAAEEAVRVKPLDEVGEPDPRRVVPAAHGKQIDVLEGDQDPAGHGDVVDQQYGGDCGQDEQVRGSGADEESPELVERAARLERGLWLCGALRLRSEEHTSELQSRENLVCRLLL